MKKIEKGCINVKQLFRNIQYKFYHFMQGRYGNDRLNLHMMYVVIFLLLLNMFMNVPFIQFVAFALWFITIYRMFSKKIYQRRKENDRYQEHIAPIKRFITLVKKQIHDRDHKYYRCPKCHQLVRIPRHRGVVTITCPKCFHTFDRKS